ncbi:hypothetical protein DKX38_025114 [Salix brachista]|uniref:Uncharacterized protein n=1 Tax=Salix brachista TaxID=2182728 RepID=A0A5N5JUE3_9ROSI|nr:hypothetical protein DKX38_025114 [Salix brachista]
MLILLIVNATDGMWKIGGVGKYSLNQEHCEEFAAFGDTWSADYSMNEDIFSSHLVDVMGQGTLRSVSTLQASMEKFQGSMFSHHECLDLEMFLEVEEPTNTRKSLVEDHLIDGEGSKVPDKIGLDETHVGTSVLTRMIYTAELKPEQVLGLFTCVISNTARQCTCHISLLFICQGIEVLCFVHPADYVRI